MQFLRDLVQENIRRLSGGMDLFRGRVCTSSTPFSADEMGMPPARLAASGRGNPVGIPHLYLASDVDTCLKESRASLHGFVSVATFRTTAEISYLDLADLGPENPFLLADVDEGNALVQSLVASRFLGELGRELSEPTRPGENPLEYVPTQYLCELVKSEGVGGIRYQSSVHAEGWNIVLFNGADANITGPVKVYEVSEMHFRFREV